MSPITPIMDPDRLSELVAKVLKEELREDEHTREQGLEQFRDWILKNPDIRDCPTDDAFLLPFLRVRKYSVPMAEQTLLRLLKFQHNFPEINSNLDILDPDINDAITGGEQFCSPLLTNNGLRAAFYIAKNADVDRGYLKSCRTVALNWHAMVRDESSQVLGYIFVIDYNKVSPAFFAMFPVSVIIGISENLEKSFSIRIKTAHVVNLPSIATWFVKLIMSALSEKLRNRIMFHSSLEELHKHVDPRVLPKEYGGTMPMDEMIGLWKKELAVHREAVLAVTNIKLVGDSFKNDLGSNDTGIPDLPGSFRKLQVD